MPAVYGRGRHGDFPPETGGMLFDPRTVRSARSEIRLHEAETLHPNGPKYVSRKTVKRGRWGDCKVIGIPHPSQAIGYDVLGAVALFIKQEMTGE